MWERFKLRIHWKSTRERCSSNFCRIKNVLRASLKRQEQTIQFTKSLFFIWSWCRLYARNELYSWHCTEKLLRWRNGLDSLRKNSLNKLMETTLCRKYTKVIWINAKNQISYQTKPTQITPKNWGILVAFRATISCLFYNYFCKFNRLIRSRTGSRKIHIARRKLCSWDFIEYILYSLSANDINGCLGFVSIYRKKDVLIINR